MPVASLPAGLDRDERTLALRRQVTRRNQLALGMLAASATSGVSRDLSTWSVTSA